MPTAGYRWQQKRYDEDLTARGGCCAPACNGLPQM